MKLTYKDWVSIERQIIARSHIVFIKSQILGSIDAPQNDYFVFNMLTTTGVSFHNQTKDTYIWIDADLCFLSDEELEDGIINRYNDRYRDDLNKDRNKVK